mgnify:CR=1 FL=1
MSAETVVETETENESDSKTLDTAIAIGIAVVSLVAALVAALAVSDTNSAAGALEDAVFATVDREKANVIANTWMYQDLRAFVQHEKLAALAANTEAAAAEAAARGDAALAQSLRDQAQSLQVSANASEKFYNEQYVLPDGAFDEAAFIAHQLRLESRNRDVNPDDDIEAAETYFTRGESFVVSVAGMAVSITFLILAQIVTAPAVRKGWFWLGVVVFVGATVYTFAAAWLRGL